MDKALLQATGQQFGKATGGQNLWRTKQTGIIIYAIGRCDTLGDRYFCDYQESIWENV